MNLQTYKDVRVHVTLANGFYYVGLVLDAGEDFLTILDKFGKKVTLTSNSIQTIRELPI